MMGGEPWHPRVEDKIIVGGKTSIFRNGELYEDFIEVDGHRIVALAEIDGDRLILRDIAIYSNEGDISNRIWASAMEKMA